MAELLRVERLIAGYGEAHEMPNAIRLQAYFVPTTPRPMLRK